MQLADDLTQELVVRLQALEHGARLRLVVGSGADTRTTRRSRNLLCPAAAFCVKAVDCCSAGGGDLGANIAADFFEACPDRLRFPDSPSHCALNASGRFNNGGAAGPHVHNAPVL